MSLFPIELYSTSLSDTCERSHKASTVPRPKQDIPSGFNIYPRSSITIFTGNTDFVVLPEEDLKFDCNLDRKYLPCYSVRELFQPQMGKFT